MAPSFQFLLILSLFLPFISSSSQPIPNTLTLPLKHFLQSNPPPPPPDYYQKLSQLATTSLTRAHHLKNPNPTPLSPHSYGAYSISLSFGTPPQTIPFIMDTGSNFVWFPCTRRYVCRNCTSAAATTFVPKQSSSARILGCLNPKCGLIHKNYNVNSRCQDCAPNSIDCRQACPPYLILYGSGSTGGIALVETLDLPGRKVSNFVVGCSIFSSHEPAGIAGFGRGPSSLPSQLGLKQFSYCLLSHRFDDSHESSLMFFESGSHAHRAGNLSYTPLIKNPVAGNHAFSVYYYVGLRKITVGGKKVKIPFNYLSPGSDGHGGTIIDSGTTFTYMTYNVYNIIVSAFTEQVKNYKRAKHVELQTGLKPCFYISGGKTVSLPEMRLHFKGGAEILLPLANYFSIAGNSEAACLTMVTDREVDRAGVTADGPAIILGNFQMQNIYTEFDLQNERFGFRQESCGR